MSLSVRPLAIGDREEDTGDGVVPGVVGEHAAHGDTAGAEVGERALQEGSAGRSALVGQGLDVGIAAVVVDGDVQVVEAGAASAWGLAGASVGAVSAAVGNACQLLHVQVQQVTGGRVFVAHALSGHAMQAVETVETEAPEHGVDRGAGDPQRPADAVRPEALAALTEQMRRSSSGGVRRGRRRGAEPRSSSPDVPASW